MPYTSNGCSSTHSWCLKPSDCVGRCCPSHVSLIQHGLLAVVWQDHSRLIFLIMVGSCLYGGAAACYDRVNLSHVRCTHRLQIRPEACLSFCYAAPGAHLHSNHFTASCCLGLLRLHGNVDICAGLLTCCTMQIG